MDCHKAQAQLEFTTLGQDAVGGPDLSAAQRHLADCDACHQTFESQRRFDTKLARAMSDVALPPGLNERLSAAIGAASNRPVPTVRPRGRSIPWISGAVVSLVLALYFSGILGPRIPRLNQFSVHQLAELDLNVLPADMRQDAFSPPDEWSALQGIQFGESLRLAKVGGAEVPVMPFQLPPNRRAPHVTGFLIQLPLSRWHETPEATSFSSATIQYASFGTWVVWREGDTVFICVVRDNADALQRMQDLVVGSRELT